MKKSLFLSLAVAAMACFATAAHAGLMTPEGAAVALAFAFIGNVVDDTLGLLKGALSKPNDEISKSVTVATGLTAYDLQAPAKNLYPVNTPLRNKIKRVSGIGPATNWREIRAINGSGFDAMAWVPEGQRSGRMSYVANPKSASYVTLGEEDSVTFEAVSAGQGFEDVRATGTMRLLQKMMLKEENAIIGGNASLALGVTPTPTVSASGTGSTLPAATYSVICVALTYEGRRGASLAAGIPTSQTITGADGQTYTLNGGSAAKSAAGASPLTTAGQSVFASVTPVNGAVGYAWFVGAAGSERLEAITAINSVAFSAPLLGTGQLASAFTAADRSRNAGLAFDGFLSVAFTPGVGSYVKTMATGTPGTGTKLTASNRGTVKEIDELLFTMWDNHQVSPDVIFVNAQELAQITDLAMVGAGGQPLLQIYTPPGSGYAQMQAGGVVGWYFNPFAMNGGMRIPVLLHPTLPAGTILCWVENLPMQYQSNGVPNVVEMKTRRDYYQLDWPLRTRMQEFGVYAEEVMAFYAPFCLGVITNIAK